MGEGIQLKDHRLGQQFVEILVFPQVDQPIHFAETECVERPQGAGKPAGLPASGVHLLHDFQHIANRRVTSYRTVVETELFIHFVDGLLEKIQNVALTTFEKLLLRDYARIDLRITPDKEVYVIEANPNPLIADDEDLAHAAWASGIKYPELIDTIIKLALARGRK